MEEVRVPPQNLEAEVAVLSAMLQDISTIPLVIEKLEDHFFYKPEHRKIYKGILELYDRGQPVDVLTLCEHLRKKGELEEVGGASYVGSISASLSSPVSVEHYADIIREKAILRGLIEVSHRIIQKCYEESEEGEKILDEAEQLVFDLAQKKKVKDFVHIRELVEKTMERAEKLSQRKEMIVGLPTGFRELDIQTAGLHPSNLIVVAGRPSMGKTSFVLNIALHVSLELELPVAIFSMEMSRDQLTERLVCMEGRVNLHQWRSGFLGEEEWPKLSMAAGRISDAPIYVDDSSTLTTLELRAKARRLKSKENIQLIIVDYLQLMKSATRQENRQQEISEISRSLKNLARELNIPVIAVSQLSRRAEERADYRPRLSDLRESGAIEQDADLVLLLFREEYYRRDTENRGICEVNIAKQRNGPVGTVKLAFIEEYTRFEDLTWAEDME